MKKIIFSFLIMLFPLFATADILEHLKKMKPEAKKAVQLKKEGQTIKANRIFNKLEKELNSIFGNGKVITFGDKNYIQRLPDMYNDEIFAIREFTDSRDLPYEIRFKFFHADDIHAGYIKSTDLTQTDVVEKFEESMHGMTGVVKIISMLGETYTFAGNNKILIVYCKILRIEKTID